MNMNTPQLDPALNEEPADPFTLFKEFFRFRGCTDEFRRTAFDSVMRGGHGLHLRLVGTFWEPEGAVEFFRSFTQFVEQHRVATQVTWHPCWPGGWWGVECWLAPLDQCSLEWIGDKPKLVELTRRTAT